MFGWQDHKKSRQQLSCQGLSIVAVLLAFGHVSAQSSLRVSGYEISIATQLKEVQQGSIDGRDYLTLNIGGHEVGPRACRSNVLRMEKGSNNDDDLKTQEQIEATAIAAMLTRKTVMIVVPLDTDKCIDGKPTFTDLYELPVRS